MNIVDSHCHIDGERFDEDRDAVIQSALDSGVVAMVNIGTGNPKGDSFEKTVELAESNECIYAAVGIHPHDAVEYDEAVEDRLIALTKSSKKVIGWGEIGLDFYYEHSTKDIQKKVFRRQINIAQELELPIIIHSRDADDETVEILTDECSYEGFRGGIMHCFGGTPEMAKALMDIGFLISFAGNVTFKNADNLRESAAVVPLDKLLVETDCPYLTPVPFRGKRNEPARVVETAKFLAEFYEIEFEKFANQTTENFNKFFNLDI